MKVKHEYLIEWPEINFRELNEYYVENKTARMMYKGLLALLFIPGIILIAFYQILKFKGHPSAGGGYF